jgi:hypothetical protein
VAALGDKFPKWGVVSSPFIVVSISSNKDLVIQNCNEKYNGSHFLVFN